ncbi:MAG: LysM peptidoglycan-binding domain-containing protein [Adhaeribacter sp.]
MTKKPFLILFFLLILGQGLSLAAAMPLDSIGVETRNGKSFVVHKVIPKETLFALSRKYHVPVDKIVDANPKIQSGLQVGQLVYIPRNTPAAAPAAAPATAAPAPAKTAPVTPAPTSRTFVVDANGNKMHQVAEKQTLFSISRLYGVTVADIKKWNQMTSDQVAIGSQLIVGVGNKPTSAPQYSQEPDDDLDKAKDPAVKTVVTTPKPASEPVAKTTPAPVTPAPAPVKTDEAGGDESESISKITETGLAEVIDNRSDNNKYLALHKSAPVGTILQVKNLMNGQSVYVRVIGKLPETGMNDKLIIRISNRAYQKLAALDARFRVEVSYMP